MLQIILHAIIITFIAFIWGIPIYLVILSKNARETFWFRSPISRLVLLYFSGLISLSFATSIICLFRPPNFTSISIFTLCLVMYLIINKKKYLPLIYKPQNILIHPTSYLIFAATSILVFLLLGSLQPSNADTHIYHIQIVKWQNEYGTVPGIANLFPRLGLGSNWFNLISAFYLPIFKNQNFTYLNTTTVIWFFLWLLDNWRYHTLKKNVPANQNILSLFYLLILFYCFYDWEIFRDSASSTNYDFVVLALSLISISFLIETILFPEKNEYFSLPFIIFTISIPPFKFSGIFILLLLPFYLLVFHKAKYWFITFCIGAAIMIPLLIKNYINTGYPLFPLSLTFFQADWAVPVEMTNYLKQYIYVTNRFYNHPIDFSKIPELNNQEWIQYWLKGILIRHKLLIGLAILSPLTLFFRNKSINLTGIRKLVILLLLMAVGWFLTAPAPRFGFAVLLILAFFSIAFFLGKYFSNFAHLMLLAVLQIGMSYYLISKLYESKFFSTYFLKPAKIYSPPFKTITIKNINFHIPEIINNNWHVVCHNVELPCICQENPYLQPRGNSLKNGFKMIGKPDSNFIRNYEY